MKKSVIAVIALAMMLMAVNASANVIGIFGDADATTCATTMNAPYVTVSVYFRAVLTDVPAITAAEFGAENVALPGMTLPTVVWNTTLVIGDILTPAGVALAFTTPLQGPVCALGQINYFVLVPPPADTFQQVVESEAGVLAIVDEDFNTIPADGWGHVINCVVGGQYGACDCLDNIPTQETSWGSVKSLY